MRPTTILDNTMATLLKRKRESAEAMETPKRTKSVNLVSETNSSVLNAKSGWAAAFPIPSKEQELVAINGADSSEVLDFEVINDESFQAMEAERWKRAQEQENAQKALKRAMKRREQHAWKMSEPIGGRMINVDPAFTPGEK